MNDYVTKPIEERELLGVLSKWLPVTQGTAAAATPRGDQHVDRPAELPGIDVTAGLRRASGNCGQDDQRLGGEGVEEAYLSRQALD